MKKQNSAITLIALIITIVVMLILAGISLNMLFGENGIINKAKLGKTKFLGEDAREVIEQRVAALRQEQAQKGVDTSFYDFWFMYNGDPTLATYDSDMYIYLFTDEMGAKLKPTLKTTTAHYSKNVEYKTAIVIYKDYLTIIDKELTVAKSTLYLDEMPAEQLTAIEATIPATETENPITMPATAKTTIKEAGVTTASTAGGSAGTGTIVANSIKTTRTTETSEILDSTWWDNIETIAKTIASDSNITSDTSEVSVTVAGKTYTFGVGDTYSLNAITGSDTPYRIRVLGFNHDDLVGDPYGNGATKAGITFEFLDCLGFYAMNDDETTYGGWGATKMRAYLNGIQTTGSGTTYTFNDTDTDTKNDSLLSILTFVHKIKDVSKEYIMIYNDYTSVNICNDKIWLISTMEIGGAAYDGIATEGIQYKFYKEFSGWPYQRKNTAYWWLRTPNKNSYRAFNVCAPYRYGPNASEAYRTDAGLAPGFCI